MTHDIAQIRAILQRVDDTLKTAWHGFEDVVATDRNRRFTGIRNVIVFGRSVTFVLQNLKSHADGFEEWYQAEATALAADPLMRYFVEARNQIEKQGKLNVASSMHLRSFSTGDMSKFGPPPRGATSFFIGDQLGGTGWEIALGEGQTAKYYVQLPTSVGEVSQHFLDFPAAKAPELAGRSVDDLCELYLERLVALVQRARKEFLPSEPPRGGHLRRGK
jgi:hypothetical protein